MRRILLFLLIWFLINSITTSPYPKPIFGLNVSISPNSKTSTYVCYIHNGHDLSKKSRYDITSFGKILTGKWPSLYNPEKKDLLKEYDIDYTWEHDDYLNKDFFYCPSFDSLWKIRFGTYPFKSSSEKGWSRHYHKPSLNQLKYLNERYGIKQIDSDYFLDTSFFMLLKDVVDPQWIARYNSIP